MKKKENNRKDKCFKHVTEYTGMSRQMVSLRIEKLLIMGQRRSYMD